MLKRGKPKGQTVWESWAEGNTPHGGKIPRRPGQNIKADSRFAEEKGGDSAQDEDALIIKGG
jgi:hypothetical protein